MSAAAGGRVSQPSGLAIRVSSAFIVPIAGLGAADEGGEAGPERDRRRRPRAFLHRRRQAVVRHERWRASAFRPPDATIGRSAASEMRIRRNRTRGTPLGGMRSTTAAGAPARGAMNGPIALLLGHEGGALHRAVEADMRGPDRGVRQAILVGGGARKRHRSAEIASPTLGPTSPDTSGARRFGTAMPADRRLSPRAAGGGRRAWPVARRTEPLAPIGPSATSLPGTPWPRGSSWIERTTSGTHEEAGRRANDKRNGHGARLLAPGCDGAERRHGHRRDLAKRFGGAIVDRDRGPNVAPVTAGRTNVPIPPGLSASATSGSPKWSARFRCSGIATPTGSTSETSTRSGVMAASGRRTGP